MTLTGETAGEGFGTSPSVAGDVDHDGHADLIVGAWQNSKEAIGGGGGPISIPAKTVISSKPSPAEFQEIRSGLIPSLWAMWTGTVPPTSSGWSGVHGYHSGRVFIISSGVKTK